MSSRTGVHEGGRYCAPKRCVLPRSRRAREWSGVKSQKQMRRERGNRVAVRRTLGRESETIGIKPRFRDPLKTHSVNSMHVALTQDGWKAGWTDKTFVPEDKR